MASQKVLHVAGYESCGFFARTLQVLKSLSVLFPSRVRVVPHSYDDRAAYRAWLIDGNFRSTLPDPRAATHSSSPFVWIQEQSTSDSDAITTSSPPPPRMEFLGGHDDTLEWCRNFLRPCNDDKPYSSSGAPTMMKEDGHTSDHPYEYDLVVIGGGSGGMAAAKEAAALGAKVACLDFVKPSPHGTTWGLGGTCVNVGCIPKKLFHIGALLRESVHHDSSAFGLAVGVGSGGGDREGGGGNALMLGEDGQLPPPVTSVQWGLVRDNIQNYIKSLNFKYRVRLREKNVTYLNKLAKFVDPHTIEAIDKKGRSSTITASRFLVAVGGRPTLLDCEGGELAISSDDVFSIDKPPGKTLCIGASYISLECAGFLAGLGHPVTVAVRSILLRGFDRECADRIDRHMVGHGIAFRREVTPTKLVKTDQGRIAVTFSDGSDDVFDTVLVAIGRVADTHALGLENVGVQVNPKNGKILGSMEQSSCPNIYAVGDVLEGSQELTPVAIQAGILLARRLFGGSREPMDYRNVCTTVFTPIEYACVGYSEDEAIQTLGADNVEVYHREFQPLEWTLSHERGDSKAFTKAIVDKTQNDKVIGIHYVGPNAGEVMQGYGVAIRRGLTFKDLTDTVGIHPTSSEEIVTLAITKRSGEDAAAGGC